MLKVKWLPSVLKWTVMSLPCRCYQRYKPKTCSPLAVEVTTQLPECFQKVSAWSVSAMLYHSLKIHFNWFYRLQWPLQPCKLTAFWLFPGGACRHRPFKLDWLPAALPITVFGLPWIRYRNALVHPPLKVFPANFLRSSNLDRSSKSLISATNVLHWMRWQGITMFV